MVWRNMNSSSSRMNNARNLYNSTSHTSPEIITGQGNVVAGLTSEESSEGELVEVEEKPWPPVGERTSRPKRHDPEARKPRPHSHLFRISGGRARASKHTRRWENSSFLTSLHAIPEEELEEDYSITPSHNSPLSRLHCSDKCMQEEQDRITARMSQLNLATTSADDHNNLPPPPVQTIPTSASPSDCFKRIRIKSIFQHNRHLPLGLIAALETELWDLFSMSSHAVILMLQDNPFWRMLLHGICQYGGLKSVTEHYKGAAIVVVECVGAGTSGPPALPLAAYLQSRSAHH